MSEFPKLFDNSKPIYILPKDDVTNSVIIPAFKASESVAIMMGFFSSASLSEISPGLAEYLRNSDKILRLIVSPYISQSDQDALNSGIESAESIGKGLFFDLVPNADELSTHTLSCLAWLISEQRLEIKIAVMRDALFHPKVWLFNNGPDSIALHGSANMTGRGLTKNREQLALARTWKSQESNEAFSTLNSEFDLLWNGGDSNCITLPLSEALRDKIVKDFKGERQPNEEDFKKLWRRVHGLQDEELNISELLKAERDRNFSIPDWLEYRSGAYTHQGEAVDSWLAVDGRGVLEMCTGSGKTLTAMIAAHHLYEREKSLLIVVCAPYKVLVNQWCDEIREFGIRPVNLTQCSGPNKRKSEIENAKRRLCMKTSTVEVLVVSNDTLCTPDFIAQVSKHVGPSLLIADECHNLGADAFINNPPESFEFRLGLSATPIRQYDQVGTDALFKYFGPSCFTYSLEAAIGTCLTPYDYHVKFVELTSVEMEKWREISEKISKLSWKFAARIKDDHLENLLLQRRRILESAESKISLLNDLIDEEDYLKLNYTLVYATDKNPAQLEAVNLILREKGIKFHQLSAEETSNSKKASQILDQFQSGALQVLTAKRVLDEGVNVPQVMRAYILASTTVKRQWVQRRGRLLRTCKAIGKTHAVIYDFVAMPPESFSGSELDADAKKIINSELDRVWEFARLSRNGSAVGGPFDAVEKLRTLVGG